METVTQFIRKAALKSKIIHAAMGKIVEYSDIDLVKVNDEKCYLCGGYTDGHGRPVSIAILPTFTDRDKARFPQSQSICPGCAFCLSFSSLRNYSMISTENKLLHPTRQELRQNLLLPPEPPFVFCVAVSGQKWLHFRTKISFSEDNFPVQFEETLVYVNVEQFTFLLSIIEVLYDVFSKEEIFTGDYKQNRIKQFGISRFQQTEDKLSKYRGQRLFNLAVYVAQKEEKSVL